MISINVIRINGKFYEVKFSNFLGCINFVGIYLELIVIVYLLKKIKDK